MLKEPNQIDIQPIFNNQFQCKVSKVLVLRNRDKDLRKSVLYNLCKRRFQRQSLTNLPEVQESTIKKNGIRIINMTKRQQTEQYNTINSSFKLQEINTETVIAPPKSILKRSCYKSNKKSRVSFNFDKFDSSLKLADLLKESHEFSRSSLNKIQNCKNKSIQREALSKVLAKNNQIKSLKQIIPIAPSSRVKKINAFKSSMNNFDFSNKFEKAYKAQDSYWSKNRIINQNSSLSRDKMHLKSSNIDDMMLTSASNEHDGEADVRVF